MGVGVWNSTYEQFIYVHGCELCRGLSADEIVLFYDHLVCHTAVFYNFSLIYIHAPILHGLELKKRSSNITAEILTNSIALLFFLL